LIYVFYSNDPLYNDQGGGVEHFRGISRALKETSLDFMLISSKMDEHGLTDANVQYISSGPNFLKYYLYLWVWFFKNRRSFTEDDVFHFHRNYAAWPKYVFLAKIGKTIITYHGLTGLILKSFVGPIWKPFRTIMIFFEKQSLSLADTIIFVSERDREIMRMSLLGNNYSKSMTIPAAFNESLFNNSNISPIEYKNKILIVARLSEIKNIPLAIETIELLCMQGHNVTLTIAGEGENRTKVERYINNIQYGDRIRMLGSVPHDQIPKLMRMHGVVLLTSRSEASPTVVKEAIASSRPIVATDVGDVKSWVVNGENGYICEATSSSLARGILDAQDLIQVKKYSQAVSLSKLSEKNIMTQLINKYVEKDIVRPA